MTKEEREEARRKSPSSVEAEQSVDVSVDGSERCPPDVMSTEAAAPFPVDVQ